MTVVLGINLAVVLGHGGIIQHYVNRGNWLLVELAVVLLLSPYNVPARLFPNVDYRPSFSLTRAAAHMQSTSLISCYARLQCRLNRRHVMKSLLVSWHQGCLNSPPFF